MSSTRNVAEQFSFSVDDASVSGRFLEHVKASRYVVNTDRQVRSKVDTRAPFTLY